LLGFLIGIIPGLLSGLVGWHTKVAIVLPAIWIVGYVCQRAKNSRGVSVITYGVAVLGAVGFGSSVWLSGNIMSNDQIATEGDRVSVHYMGTLDSGEEFDSSRDRGPLTFVLGAGQMILGFDAAVNGMQKSDSKTVRLEPAEAYGEHSYEFIVEFPIDQLPDGFTEGSTVQFQNGAQGTIMEVTAEKFVVDANHRLAGQALTFEIELVSIE